MRSRIFYSTLFVLFTFYLSAQNDTLYEDYPIWQKMKKLFSSNKIDSLKSNVVFFKYPAIQKDTCLRFYVYRDTVALKNHFFTTGLMIIDPFDEYDFLPVGEWKTFYPGGNLFSTGTYSVGQYQTCAGGGPSTHGYSYRNGSWEFFYENRKLMAKGYFDIETVCKRFSIGNQFFLESGIGRKMIFYDKKGRISVPDPEMGKVISNYIENRLAR